jgi:hypothetical protein
MRSLLSWVSVFALVAVACGGSRSGGADPTEDDFTKKKGGALPPIALQYVGTYDWQPSTPGGDVQWLSIQRDGTYTLHWAMDEQGNNESGTIASVDVASTQENGTKGPGYPVVLHLKNSGKQIPEDPKTATFSDCCSGKVTLGLTLEKTSFDLKANGSVGPDESICGKSKGSWFDDDADPKTGLYCVCPAGQAYIPSLGGCVK